MFHSDITFMLALIAFTGGAFLLFHAKLNIDKNLAMFRIFGYCVAGLSLIVLLYTIYPAFKKMTYSYYRCPWHNKDRNMMLEKDQKPLMKVRMHGQMPD